MRKITLRYLWAAFLTHNIFISKYIPDRIYLMMVFHGYTGRGVNLDCPKGFNEKIQWLKLNDRKPEYTVMADKYQAKQYTTRKIGEEYIIPTLGIWDSFNQIDFDKLPDKFVLKCTHDSGSTIIIDSKKKFNMKLAEQKLNKALKKNFFYYGREWPYKNIEKRIIAEKYIGNASQMTDYKFMCFNGKVRVILVCTERYAKDGLKLTFFDKEWNKLPFSRQYHRVSTEKIDKPANLQLMIGLAEKLAGDIPFVRVDLYEIRGKVYFGEMTFFPESGMEGFTPSEYDDILGEYITLPMK